MRREDGDDAVDRLGRVERVQRGQDEVSGLGRQQRGFNRLEVAHLADEDDVRILAQGAAQRLTNEFVSAPTSRWLTIDLLSRCRCSIGSSMVMMWAVRVLLISSIIAASVVLLPLPVVPVTRISPRSSAAIFLSTGGSARSSMVARLHRDDAEAHADRAALLEGVAAEPAEPGHAVGQVDFVALLEFFALARGQDRGRDGHHVLVIEPSVGHGAGRGRRGPAASDSSRLSGGGPTRRSRPLFSGGR